jgi:hypothetical protein
MSGPCFPRHARQLSAGNRATNSDRSSAEDYLKAMEQKIIWSMQVHKESLVIHLYQKAAASPRAVCLALPVEASLSLFAWAALSFFLTFSFSCSRGRHFGSSGLGRKVRRPDEASLRPSLHVEASLCPRRCGLRGP